VQRGLSTLRAWTRYKVTTLFKPSCKTSYYNDTGASIEKKDAPTAKVQGIPKPLLPDEVDIGFTPLVELTCITQPFRLVISRAEEMGHTNRSFNIFNVFAGMLRYSAVDGSALFNILDPRDT